MQTCHTRLTDSQWEDIKEIFVVQRKRKHNLREIVDAIFWLLRIGGQWGNLPECFAKWQLVYYYYFRQWQADGTLERLNWHLNRQERERRQKAHSPRLLSMGAITETYTNRHFSHFEKS